MAMDDLAARYFDVVDLESAKKFVFNLSLDDKDMGQIKSTIEALNKVDLGLAYSSKKLVNLDNLLMHVLACESNLEAVSTEEDNFSQDFVEKALTLDLFHAILNIEIRELDNFVSSLQAMTDCASDKIFSCEKSLQLYDITRAKLHDCEESLRQSHEHIIEMKMQLAKLQMTSLALNHSECKSQMKTVKQKHILSMLERSLARELDLEKKLSELKQNEEDLKQKLHLTEQIGLCVEEAAEVTWGRFLEADNTAEVLMGISKEMVGHLQMVHSHLNSSTTREQELKLKLQDCLEELNAKETEIQKLNSSMSQLVADNSEVSSLREKVKFLEEKLRQSVSRLKETYVSNEASREQVRDMDTEIESLKESINAAESRARDAVSKLTQLAHTNVELTEELAFLKGSNDRNAEKVSSLEKQLRESELLLQHARASSETSQEQQNMLYTAIWDMETLIDELKQKVSTAEINAENTEQFMLLTETNLELSKELDFLRDRVEFLETSLNEAAVEKIACAKDIDIKTNLIMDMVMQLAIEREGIQNQLYSLTKENKILKEKLQKGKKNVSTNLLQNEGTNFPPSKLDSTNATAAETSEEITAGIFPKISQVDSHFLVEL